MQITHPTYDTAIGLTHCHVCKNQAVIDYLDDTITCTVCGLASTPRAYVTLEQLCKRYFRTNIREHWEIYEMTLEALTWQGDADAAFSRVRRPRKTKRDQLQIISADPETSQ